MIKGENSSKDDELQAMLNFLTTVQEVKMFSKICVQLKIENI